MKDLKSCVNKKLQPCAWLPMGAVVSKVEKPVIHPMGQTEFPSLHSVAHGDCGLRIKQKKCRCISLKCQKKTYLSETGNIGGTNKFKS